MNPTWSVRSIVILVRAVLLVGLGLGFAVEPLWNMGALSVAMVTAIPTPVPQTATPTPVLPASAPTPIPTPTPTVQQPPPVPKVVDTTGQTRFYYVFISGGEEFNKWSSRLQDAFGAWPNAAGGSSRLLQTPLIDTVLSSHLEALKIQAVPGNEVVIVYDGHGGDGPQFGAPNGDDPDNFDNHITHAGQFGETITDDELARMISGFQESVTIVVILSSCYGGTFADGTTDLPSATNANGQAYGDHLALIGPTGTIRDELTKGLLEALKDKDEHPRADANRDGILSASELRSFFEAEGALTTHDGKEKKKLQCSAPSN